MTVNKRMRLETVRKKLLESYMDSYYEIISNDGSIEGWSMYNKGKMTGLSQSLIYLGISNKKLDDVKNKCDILFKSKST